MFFNNTNINGIYPKITSLLNLLFDWLIWSIIVVSISAIITLILGVFVPKNVFFIGIAISTGLIAFRLKDYKIMKLKMNYKIVAVLAILFIALALRLEPNPYVYGGQDQGVYVNMSSYFQREGYIFIEDKFLNNLPPGQIKDIYLQNRTDNGILPGVYYGGNKDYVFQFYHLHPLWMAIFADLFGNDARFYSLTFFSLLSIVGVFLLVRVLSKSYNTAYLAAFLIAVNPLHVFFSRWPVTEVIALAFSVIGFYYLYRAWCIAKEHKQLDFWYIILGMFSFSLLYFVRITGFMYIPFIVVLLWVGIWLYNKKDYHAGLVLTVFSLFNLVVYAISVIYGLVYSRPYAIDIYRGQFGNLFGPNWPYYLIIIAAFASSCTLSWYYMSKLLVRDHVKCENAVLIISSFILGLLIAIATAVNFYKTYMLAYTDVYLTDSWYGIRWGLSGQGIETLLRSSALNWTFYVSPFIILAAIIIVFKIKWNWTHLLLLLFIVLFLVPNFVFRLWVIPYQYYYSRYLLSEVVPYSIILGTIIIRQYKVGKVASFMKHSVFMLTIIGFAYLSMLQYVTEEGNRANTILKDISSKVDTTDVVLYVKNNWSTPAWAFQTPLLYYSGLSIFPVDSEGETDFLISNALLLTEGELFLLSPHFVDDDRLTFIKRYLSYDNVMERSGHVPLAKIDNYWYQELYLFGVNYADMCKPPNCLFLRATDRRMATQVGESINGTIQSTSKEGFIIYGPYLPLNGGFYNLSIEGKIELNGGNAWVDVVADKGNYIIEKFDIVCDSEVFLIKDNVRLKDRVEDLEIRIWVNEYVSVEVYTIRLQAIE